MMLTEADHVAGVDILIEGDVQGLLLLCLQTDVVRRELDLREARADRARRAVDLGNELAPRVRDARDGEVLKLREGRRRCTEA